MYWRATIQESPSVRASWYTGLMEDILSKGHMNPYSEAWWTKISYCHIGYFIYLISYIPFIFVYLFHVSVLLEITSDNIWFLQFISSAQPETVMGTSLQIWFSGLELLPGNRISRSFRYELIVGVLLLFGNESCFLFFLVLPLVPSGRTKSCPEDERCWCQVWFVRQWHKQYTGFLSSRDNIYIFGLGTLTCY